MDTQIKDATGLDGQSKNPSGFTLDMLPTRVVMKATWPKLYRDRNTGQPIQFVMTFEFLTKGEKDKEEGEALLKRKSVDDYRLDFICNHSIAEPVGWTDFPPPDNDEVPDVRGVSPSLSLRLREYFTKDKRLADFPRYFVAGYDSAVMPGEMFQDI